MTKFREEFREELKKASPINLAIRSCSTARRNWSERARERKIEQVERNRAESTKVKKKVDFLLESLREKEWKDYRVKNE